MGTNIPSPGERGRPYSLPGKIPEASQTESKELNIVADGEIHSSLCSILFQLEWDV